MSTTLPLPPLPPLLERLARLPEQQRTEVLLGLSQGELAAINSALAARADKWARYADNPVGFVTQGLGESVWSKQIEILESVHRNKRTAVPACHAPGKSWLAARAVAWWVSSHPPGTAMVVTTATTFRQVRTILWPHIRRVSQRHQLPGYETVNLVEWQRDGEIAAFGFSAHGYDESAVQGIHAPHLLVVVDEAGGIASQLGGALNSLMTGGHTRMLLLGNPPTADPDSWFEECCASELFNTIPISAYDTPNFTGEDAGICQSCPPVVPEHPVTEHLVDEEWVNDTVTQFGEHSAWVEARVHARFPHAVGSKTIPADWVEMALKRDVPLAGAIRLGVDVAGSGGDEMAIARADGQHVRVVHTQVGEQNENAVDVAGEVLRFIKEAEEDHTARGERQQVRCKVDAVGVGWGVVGLLRRWGQEGKHRSQIVAVGAGESARESDRYTNVRAEMWWTGRLAFQPTVQDDGDLGSTWTIDVDRRTHAQLSAPGYTAESTGRVQIEKKSDMKKRGVDSPDRAEAVLMAIYEPPGTIELPTVGPFAIKK